MRYFSTISYKGTNYYGWQIQPQATTVQEIIENALSTLLRQEIKIVGCGRTDAGVHAKGYVFHFDIEEPVHHQLVHRINKFLPKDLVFHHIGLVEKNAHARFDANYRAYNYKVGAEKNPFTRNTVYHYPFFKRLNKDKMQEVASLLLEFNEFTPFCKTKSDAKTMYCELYRSEWKFDKSSEMTYHIAANRFLRGMVRLIVGMCLNVGLGKLKVEAVREALVQQCLLKKSYSAPPHGLCLTDIRYPYTWK